MRTTYRVLAGLIALLVVVQAGMIAYAIGGVFSWIDAGNTLDKSVVEGWEDNPPDFDGAIGSFFHFFIIGTILIPLLGLLLLIVSFFAKVPRGPMLAGVVVLAIVAQYLLGTFAASTSTPLLSLLHGLNAFVVFGAALSAAMAAKNAGAAASSPAPAV
jgi:hypothetical protein